MTAAFPKDVTFDIEINYSIKATSDVFNFESERTKKTTKLTFSGKKLENSRIHFSNSVDFDLTTEQMLEVIFSSDAAFEDFTRCLWDDDADPDTASKDIFAEAFARFILRDDRHWPTGCDSEEYTQKFFDDLGCAVHRWRR